MELHFTKHALRKARERGIPLLDAAQVYRYLEKVARGLNGALNYYGYGSSSRYRIRVTVVGGSYVKTVAWADARKEERR